MEIKIIAQVGGKGGDKNISKGKDENNCDGNESKCFNSNDIRDFEDNNNNEKDKALRKKSNRPKHDG